MQRRVVHSGRAKKVRIVRVVPLWCKVRHDVSRTPADQHRITEAHLLPSGNTLSAELRTRQKHSRRTPQVPDVRPTIGRALIKANARNITIRIGAELYPQLVARGVARIGQRGRGTRIPDRTR